ncbi:hypothetical protein C8R47DRAFT_1238177 [Mycena vitilis]|nr:hypothetical protein C8R47DRAFT_1238177 [Mycena vitilis]
MMISTATEVGALWLLPIADYHPCHLKLSTLMRDNEWRGLGENEREACVIGYEALLRQYPKMLDFLFVWKKEGMAGTEGDCAACVPKKPKRSMPLQKNNMGHATGNVRFTDVEGTGGDARGGSLEFIQLQVRLNIHPTPFKNSNSLKHKFHHQHLERRTVFQWLRKPRQTIWPLVREDATIASSSASEPMPKSREEGSRFHGRARAGTSFGGLEILELLLGRKSIQLCPRAMYQRLPFELVSIPLQMGEGTLPWKWWWWTEINVHRKSRRAMRPRCNEGG